jgi:hypothetical protein
VARGELGVGHRRCGERLVAQHGDERRIAAA